MSDPNDLSPPDRDALLRWRLALGPGAESVSPSFALRDLGGGGGAEELGLGEAQLGEMDEALGFVYEERAGKLGRSKPYIPRWLAQIRELWKSEVVALVQRDAIVRRGLTQLLFEPETLPLLEKNVELVATLVSARGLVPERAREAARKIVREVVDQVRRALEAEVRTAVLGALRRDRTSPLRVTRNIDWRRTIRANLSGWDSAKRRLVPERFYFWQNQRRRHAFDVVILVDQSASMAESVVYSSIMAAIFASIDVFRTRLLLFDTEVVDVTPILVDPVEVLFTAQLGGGTDINRAVAYAQQHLLERPAQTLFILVSDLFEGGDREELLARMRKLVDDGARVVCLLALSDSGQPAYDHEMAAALGELDIPSFGCTPGMLAEVLGRVLKGGRGLRP